MSFEMVQSPFEKLLGTVEATYGWVCEIACLLIFVLLFNMALNWFFSRLQNNLKRHNHVWQESFFSATIQPLSYFVSLYILVHIIDLVAFHFFSKNLTQNLNIILTIGVVLSFSWFLFRWKNNIIANLSLMSLEKKVTFDKSKIDVIDKLATVFIVFITCLILLESTHKSLNTLIAFGGVGGLALAIASQEVISNFFGGIMIYTTHPFARGDWIQVPDKNIEGIVEEIGWYMTLVRSLDKRPIYVPNSIFTKTVVITPSRMTHRRFKEVISLRYSDLPAVKDIITEFRLMLKNNPDVDLRNALIVNLDGFGPYSLDILVQADLTILDGLGFAQAKDKILFQIAEIVTKHQADFASPYTSYLASVPSFEKF